MTFSRFLRVSFAAASLASLGGCQAAQPTLSLAPNPHNLIYTYLIVHGMVRGGVMSGAIPADQLPAVVMEDRSALLAVVAATGRPDASHLKTAREDIQVLLARVEPKDLPASH
ncbi:hypothetical protein J2D73_06260 [Acetobacter sacchari]|uniref:Uncharacterized protein n=1 Tax=Acetobacter sacchari TaxID=2661687 RepID=A0ABS3LU21_9PROT|nr:hypothetical protein [Acetobacter sacchari]MBO1359399.1 hypothetical protein [Acetobacter sacchari]